MQRVYTTEYANAVAPNMTALSFLTRCAMRLVPGKEISGKKKERHRSRRSGGSVTPDGPGLLVHPARQASQVRGDALGCDLSFGIAIELR